MNSRTLKSNLPAVLSICCTTVFVILSFFPGIVPSRGLLFLLFFAYLVLVPGFLLARRLLPDAGGAVLVLAGFVLGTASVFVVLFALALFELDIALVRIIVPPIVVLLALGRRAKEEPAGSSGAGEAPRGGSPGRCPGLLLVALVACVCAVILARGDPLLYTADSADHIAYIRAIARTGEAFPGSFYYPDAGLLTRDIRKGMAHALWGSLCALAGVRDAAAVWPLISLVGSAFLLVAVYAAGVLIFGSAAIGVSAALLTVLLYDGGLAQFSLVVIAAGYFFGKAYYVAALAFALSWLSSGKRSFLWLAAASMLAAAWTHIAHFAVALFMMAVFAFSAALSRSGAAARRAALGRIAALAAVTLAVNAPYLLMRYIRDYAPNNPLHTHVQGVLYLTDRLYVMNPLVFGQVTGPLGLLAVLSIFFLGRRMRDRGHYPFLASGIAATYLLLFVPLWFGTLHARFSYLLIRFEFAVPSMLVAAFFLRELFAGLRGSGRGRGAAAMSPRVAGVGIALAAVIIGYPLSRLPSRIVYTKKAAEELRPSSYRNLEDLFAHINASMPPGNVIAADPITSFGLPAFTDQYAMCPFDQHATPNDSTAIRRIVDARRLMSPWTAPREIAALLDSYGARHLVVNGRIPPHVETMYWKPTRRAAAAVVSNLETSGGFEKVFERDAVALFARDPEWTPEDGPAARGLPFVGDTIRAESVRALIDSREPGVGIVGVALDRERAARGDTVEVVVTWTATRPMPFSSYIAYLRFDTSYPQGAAYHPALAKPYRKLQERIAGRRYRFRHDFQPLGGVHPPDTWPVLRRVHDRVRVAVPRDIAPGRYVVSLRMAEKTQYPNYVLGDIFTDDDLFSGAAVAGITIE